LYIYRYLFLGPAEKTVPRIFFFNGLEFLAYDPALSGIRPHVGSGSNVAAVNGAFIAAVSMNLAPVLRSVVFLGQTHFGAATQSQSL